MQLENAAIEYKSLDPEIAYISETGLAFPVGQGRATIQATVSIDGESKTATFTLTIGSGKTESTIYTSEKRAAALENVEKYAWAREMRESTIKEVDMLLANINQIYDTIPYEGLPRAFMIGLKNDPMGYTCPYCNIDLRVKYSYYPWILDPIQDPWKIQCPD